MPLVDEKGKQLSEREVAALKDMLCGSLENHRDLVTKFSDEYGRLYPAFTERIAVIFEDARFHLISDIQSAQNRTDKTTVTDFISAFTILCGSRFRRRRDTTSSA